MVYFVGVCFLEYGLVDLKEDIVVYYFFLMSKY